MFGYSIIKTSDKNFITIGKACLRNQCQEPQTEVLFGIGVPAPDKINLRGRPTQIYSDGTSCPKFWPMPEMGKNYRLLIEERK